jgi:cellulose biosynthesis protein BcsQ
MRTIAILNQKGGVGKTTLAVNLGGRIGPGGAKKVLLMDLDPQAHLTFCLGLENPRRRSKPARGAAGRSHPILKPPSKRDGLSVVPSALSLARGPRSSSPASRAGNCCSKKPWPGPGATIIYSWIARPTWVC